jgi:hypothetical protein
MKFIAQFGLHFAVKQMSESMIGLAIHAIHAPLHIMNPVAMWRTPSFWVHEYSFSQSVGCKARI